MTKLIHDIFRSDKFEKIERNGISGYYDSHERVFIPKNSVHHLIKEITKGPSVTLGSKKLEDYFALCEVRIRRAFKKEFKNLKSKKYKEVFLTYLSKEFLKLFSDSKLNFATLYIDLVGSTVMSMKLPSQKLSTLVSIFSEEMASVVSMNQGYVLKYSGDAVIAFFPESESYSQMCQNALNCATDMRNLLKNGINTGLAHHNFEPLNIRIGIESGSNQITLIGGNIDIIGYTMNIAAKITSMSKPNGITIGQDCYSALNEDVQKEFVLVNAEDASWKYKDEKGNTYKVYQLAKDLEK
jgi:class 3 adenylate cyclase